MSPSVLRYGKIVTLTLPLPWVMLKLPAPAVIVFAASVVMVISLFADVAVPCVFWQITLYVAELDAA